MIESKITTPPLKSTTERYLDVLKKIGFEKVKLNFTSIFEFQANNFNYIKDIIDVKEGTWIGIAPFSKHDGKTIPFYKIKELVSILTVYSNIKIFLLGAGKKINHR